MSQMVKLLIRGNDQIVCLPKEYEFDCKEVLIRKDLKTGNVILSSKPENWDSFLALIKRSREDKE